MDSVHWTAAEALSMDHWLVEERGFTIPELMAVAGQRVAEAARGMLASHGLTRVVIVVGPGNNGGDGVVAAELLAGEVETSICRLLSGDALPVLDARTLVIDGLFGVGLTRAIEGVARDAVVAINASPARVLSIDVPSGLDATTGAVAGGEEGVAIVAHRTVTFVGPKSGFFVGRGPEHVGDWTAVDIGFPVEEAEAWIRALRVRAGA